jgi:4'-phosphopantetheinyl transferase EntD
VGLLPEGRDWVDTIVRFALKEAVYKALAPGLGRYIGFEEAAAWPAPDGVDRVELHLSGGEGPFAVEARHAWIGSRVLASVRSRPA